MALEGSKIKAHRVFKEVLGSAFFVFIFGLISVAGFVGAFYGAQSLFKETDEPNRVTYERVLVEEEALKVIIETWEKPVQVVEDLPKVIRTAIEENTRPASFTDLFSSLVFIDSFSSGVIYDGKATTLSFRSMPGDQKINSVFILSKNLHTGDSPVLRAKLVELEANIGSGEMRWFLSNDSVNWSRVSAGEEVVFKNKEGNVLIWRMEFLPAAGVNSLFSLDRIRLDYKIKI